MKLSNHVQANQKKFQSIRKRISFAFLAFTVSCSILLGSICIYLNFKSSMSILQTTMEESIALATERVSVELEKYKNTVNEIGANQRLSNPMVSMSEKKQLLQQKVEQYNLISAALIDTTGYSLFEGIDLSDRDYFKECMKGNTYISDLIISKTTNKPVVVLAAPLWKNGVADSEVMGVVTMTPQSDFLNEIIKEIKIGKHGIAYILDKNGLTIAHPDTSKAGVENTIELAKTDSKLAQLAKIEQEMIKGAPGFNTYTYGGQPKVIGYAPISDTNGWSLAIVALKNDFLSTFYNTIFITVIVIVSFIIIGIIAGRKLGFSISKPINECVKRLQQLAQGDLSSPIPESSSNDETELLLDGLSSTINDLKDVISDINYQVVELSNGNLCVTQEKQYKGEFTELNAAFAKITSSLNHAMKEIDENAERVFSGSKDLAIASQALSQGATDQASTIEELTATVSEISNHVQINAQHAEEATTKVEQVDIEISESNQQMQQMTSAMTKIKESSNEISNIIQTIDEIAAQTNLLSLNAAIEAARAGEAGKGFSVVAEEVRKLAEQSSNAAQTTNELIQRSIHAVEDGMKLVETTASSLQNVTAGANEVKDSINYISKATREQASALEQISQGINQVADVVQTNSATAQESAASSDSLSLEAHKLKELVGQFNYKQ